MGKKNTYSVPQKDLEFVFSRTEKNWHQLRDQRLFLSGGTGFIGTWLLESFAFANEQLGLNAKLTSLTRNQTRLFKRLPHFASLQGIEFLEGDIRDFAFPEEKFSHVIHAATASGAESLTIQPLEYFDVIVEGTRRALKFAAQARVENFLFVSSGAIYGEQPSQLENMNENYEGGPNPLLSKSTYGESKRIAEHLCLLNGEKFNFEVKFARPFAFVGPHLPLDAAFAIGNFFQSALNQTPIQIKGDGTPFRSYLYAADMTEWLWTILFKGKHGRAYNVGSQVPISIAELARTIATGPWNQNNLEVSIAQKSISGAASSRYVPSTERAQKELSLKQTHSLIESIDRTLEWHRSRQIYK